MECEICSNPSSGFHYHTRCCRACAAFFRRTVRMKLKYKCFKKGECDVQKENRYTCRHCRMKKCLAKGMAFEDDDSPEESMFLEKLPIKMESPATSELSEFYCIEEILKKKQEFMVDFQNRVTDVLTKDFHKPCVPYTRTLSQQISVAFENHRRKWPRRTKDELIHGPIDLPMLMLNFLEEMENVADFCMSLEPFAELPLDQRRLLYGRFACRFHQLERILNAFDIFGIQLEDTRSVSLNGEIFDPRNLSFVDAEKFQHRRETIKTMFIKTDLRVNELLVKPLKRLNPDHFERMFLIGIILFSLAEGFSPETLKKCRKMQESLAEELYFHYKFKKDEEKYSDRIYKLINIACAMDRTAEIREQDSLMAIIFDLFLFEGLEMEEFSENNNKM